MTKERPILYSTPMAQAKRARIKTQTRRIMKEQPDNDCYFQMELVTCDQDGRFGCLINYNGDSDPFVPCPYGKPSDILWGRETWAKYASSDCVGGVTTRYRYKAEYTDECYQWKPSIHMPKIAAQLWDRIISIRVERLQDISEHDAIAEGIEDLTEGRKLSFRDYLNNAHPLAPIASYKSLWESINGPNSWDLNPWVWVITTEILSTTGRPENL